MNVNLITKEAIDLFKQSNLFMVRNEIYIPSAPAIISAKEVLVLGTAAVLVENPEVTRRFWSGWLK